MDPSALIFVALAVAWAVYLIPKALEHHEESVRTRTVERFSKTMRVLARREPVNRRTARLVTPTSGATAATKPGATSGATAGTATVTVPADRTASRPAPPVAPPTPEQLRARRRAAARAARRRLRVVTLLLVANAVVAALAWFSVIEWVWCAVPVGLLAAWLVACRLMVKRERADRPQARIATEPPAEAPKDATEEVAVVDAPLLGEEPAERDPDAWDPVYAPLPTYVSKPVARRTVTTIDLDSTGVWSSGRSAADSKLVHEADAAAERSGSTEASERRASGA